VDVIRHDAEFPNLNHLEDGGDFLYLLVMNGSSEESQLDKRPRGRNCGNSGSNASSGHRVHYSCRFSGRHHQPSQHRPPSFDH
jgi:hypothetical protein